MGVNYTYAVVMRYSPKQLGHRDERDRWINDGEENELRGVAEYHRNLLMTGGPVPPWDGATFTLERSSLYFHEGDFLGHLSKPKTYINGMVFFGSDYYKNFNVEKFIENLGPFWIDYFNLRRGGQVIVMSQSEGQDVMDIFQVGPTISEEKYFDPFLGVRTNYSAVVDGFSVESAYGGYDNKVHLSF